MTHRTEPRMTPQQELVTQVLMLTNADGSDLWTAREIADRLEQWDPGIRVRLWTYDRVHAILRTLERKGTVRRLRNPGGAASDWRLETHHG